jgi:UDP-2-acetamido-3-amino-2,3-dideoxy-glucuronate N-acetyltransferase
MEMLSSVNDFFAHPNALVESASIGEGTRIWAFAHIMPDASIGKDCNIGNGVFIESGVRIGDGVTIKNNVQIWKGVEVRNYAFLGPNVVFSNDRFPRSARMPGLKDKYKSESLWLSKTIVDQGASIGANATIVCGVHLGIYCMIGAGSVVTHDVVPYQLVAGNPARKMGFVNKQGDRVTSEGNMQ